MTLGVLPGRPRNANSARVCKGTIYPYDARFAFYQASLKLTGNSIFSPGTA
jgi:hypothetical protein